MRDFYIAETVKNNWTVRQLERQIYSSLWERLLMGNDKQSVLALARNEKEPSDAKEIIKDPMYLEFLGLKRESSYYEKDLEQAIITHLHDFLLELKFKAAQAGCFVLFFNEIPALSFPDYALLGAQVVNMEWCAHCLS